MKARRTAVRPREAALLVLAGLILFMLAAIMLGINVGASRTLPGGGAFYAAWSGARAYLVEGGEAYSASAAERAQQLNYGRPAREGENPFLLTTPFYLLPLYFPFALLPDAVLARALWMCVGEAALLAAAALSFQLIDWQPPRLFWIAYLLLSVLSLYSTAEILSGSPVGLLLLLYLASLWALRSGRDELAGAWLALGLFAWQVGLPFLLLVAWSCYREKRSRVLLGFGMLWILLLVISFLLSPGWVVPFLRAVWNDVRTPYGSATAGVLSVWWPSFGVLAARLLTGALVILLGVEWASAGRIEERRFQWVCALTLAATPLLGQRLEIGDLVIVLPALTLILASATARWRMRYALTGLLYLILLLLPWGLVVRGLSVRDSLYLNLAFLFLPVFALVGLYWTRWWLLRPPRTWLDQVHGLT